MSIVSTPQDKRDRRTLFHCPILGIGSGSARGCMDRDCLLSGFHDGFPPLCGWADDE